MRTRRGRWYKIPKILPTSFMNGPFAGCFKGKAPGTAWILTLESLELDILAPSVRLLGLMSWSNAKDLCTDMQQENFRTNASFDIWPGFSSFPFFLRRRKNCLKIVWTSGEQWCKAKSKWSGGWRIHCVCNSLHKLVVWKKCACKPIVLVRICSVRNRVNEHLLSSREKSAACCLQAWKPQSGTDSQLTRMFEVFGRYFVVQNSSNLVWEALNVLIHTLHQV